MIHRAERQPGPRAAWRVGLLAILLAVGVLPAGYASGPDETVRTLNAALLDAMRMDGADGFSQRKRRLEPVLREGFDLDFIAGAVLGTHASGLDDSSREAFEETFARLVVNTYAARFKGYQGHTITIGETREMRGGRRLVRTLLSEPGESPVSLDYLLQRDGEKWRIVNVVSSGVSDLSLRRAEYGSIITREGFDSLLAQLENQARAYESAR